MKKIFHLSSCSTCVRIINELNPGPEVKLHDIKTQPISEAELDSMAAKAGSYEALFSRRAIKFRQWDLHTKTLTESDFRELILKEYTFLKRPVIINDNELFVGNSKKVVGAAVISLCD